MGDWDLAYPLGGFEEGVRVASENEVDSGFSGGKLAVGGEPDMGERDQQIRFAPEDLDLSLSGR